MKRTPSAPTPDEPNRYQIKVEGRLDQRWNDYFDGFSLATEPAPPHGTFTILTGTVTDQAALHGILNRIRDLGLQLYSVKCLDAS